METTETQTVSKGGTWPGYKMYVIVNDMKLTIKRTWLNEVQKTQTVQFLKLQKISVMKMSVCLDKVCCLFLSISNC